MKKSSKAKYFIVIIGIVSLVSLFCFYYFNSKSISDPLDQIKEYGEKMKEWENAVTEMNGIFEDVKSTVQKETIANK